MPNNPFLVVPWQVPFLPVLRDTLLKLSSNSPGETVVVFPHDRPKRYLADLFKPDALPALAGRPIVLPRMFTVKELFAFCRRKFPGQVPGEASTLDQVALLWQAVQQVSPNSNELCTALATMTPADFFPWGVQLATIFEECLNNGLTPTDLYHAEGEVAPFAAALLSALRQLFLHYRKSLAEHGLSTPGLDAFTVVDALNEQLPWSEHFQNRPLILAGFSALNGCEERLFHTLWKQGATVCIQGDPDLVQNPTRHHHACDMLARWISRWRASCQLIGTPPHQDTPTYHFFKGHDLHSQLEALQQNLLTTTSAQTETTVSSLAIVLTSSSALLPVLHHIKTNNCNISLGYPLNRTLLFRLLDAILTLRNTLTPAGTVHWKRLAELFRHPCLRMLSADGVSLRSVLQLINRQLREGKRMVNPFEFVDRSLSRANCSAGIKKLLTRVLQVTVGNWQTAETTADLADCLWELCQLLVKDGSTIWSRFPLDAEGLFRIVQHVIPALRTTLMAREALPWPLASSILKTLISAERIPFEADPLTGIQVLGMLETRLLHFQHVFIVDVTEDHLPGSTAISPLLPDSLREALGLPDAENRDKLAAYTFFRLLAGSEHAYLYWQEGVESGAFSEGRKQRSRFIEELIWLEEKKRGQLLVPGEGILRTPNLQLRPFSRARTEIFRTPAIQRRISAFLRKPLSPSALNTYLTCPVKFWYTYLCGLAPLQTVLENDDPASVGTLFHNTLHAYYTPFVGQKITRDDLNPDALIQLFFQHLDTSMLPENLPPESLAVLRTAGPKRLRLFLENQPAQLRILGLEQPMEATLLNTGSYHLSLGGRLDRVDERYEQYETQTIILDYKTGSVRVSGQNVWTDDMLFDHIEILIDKSPEELCRLLDDQTADPLPQLAELFPSLQLPAYLFLLRKQWQCGDNAAFVELKTKGTEIPLFTRPFDTGQQTDIFERKIPLLLRFVASHLACCPSLRPREGNHCTWCTAAKYCLKTL